MDAAELGHGVVAVLEEDPLEELLGSVVEGEAHEGFTETRVDVAAGECLRVFAVAEASVPSLLLEVRDGKGGKTKVVLDGSGNVIKSGSKDEKGKKKDDDDKKGKKKEKDD